jgi:hypothetical protein
MLTSRRRFLSTGAASATLAAAGGPALAAMGPDDKFDLVIKVATCSIRASLCAGGATSASATA